MTKEKQMAWRVYKSLYVPQKYAVPTYGVLAKRFWQQRKEDFEAWYKTERNLMALEQANLDSPLKKWDNKQQTQSDE